MNQTHRLIGVLCILFLLCNAGCADRHYTGGTSVETETALSFEIKSPNGSIVQTGIIRITPVGNEMRAKEWSLDSIGSRGIEGLAAGEYYAYVQADSGL